MVVVEKIYVHTVLSLINFYIYFSTNQQVYVARDFSLFKARYLS